MSKHYEGLGDKWASLLTDPPKELPELIPFVLTSGATRPNWQASTGKKESMMVVWPQESPLRASVTVHGKAGEQLQPTSVMPLIDGLPNDMTVEDVRPWKSETDAYVAACRNEDSQPIWFHSPAFFRDRDALTTGVRHTFSLAAMAYGVRRALLDEMTVTEGAQYEAYCIEWLSRNPEKTRLDVPQLTISLEGARILQPGEYFGDYQLRVPIENVEETTFRNMKVYMLYTRLGLNTENPLDLVIYAPETICKNITPQIGDEIDALIWLQGRIVD